MFIPQNSSKLQDRSTQYRIAIQGTGGCGKTTSALTFPGAIIADIDNSVDTNNAIAAGVDPSTITVLPFYEESFLKTIPARNTKDGLEIWLNKYLQQLTKEQTFILDSWSFMHDAFDVNTPIPISKSSGAEDWLTFWAWKQDYSQLILRMLQNAQCNIIVVFHETAERDDKGRLTGKVGPLMQGRFADRLHNYFPYWFRQFALDKITDPEKKKKEIETMGITSEQFDALQSASGPRQPSYIWQTVTSNLAKCKTKIPFARFIPARYNVFTETEKWLQK